ncbi:MAG: hypothetical protein ACKVOP_04585 [Sphingomonadaceae bacterium]
MRASVLLFLSLAACGSDPRAAPNETDPAILEALADPIMADPQLAAQDGGSVSVTVPVGAMPKAADNAMTLRQIATQLRRTQAFAACNPDIDHAYAWMGRLPRELAPPAAAMVIEAGGSDTPGCKLRIVRYGIAQAPAEVAQSIRAQAAKAGFVLSGDDASLRGTRSRDAAAFWTTIAPVESGAAVDLAVNRGG